MGRISPFSTFRVDDFPSERQWIGKLFLPLNNILTQVTQALNGQIVFSENIPALTRTVSGANLTLPLSFQVEDNFKPTQMVVAQASRSGTPIAMIGAWSQTGDTLTVSKLFEVSETGMTALSSGTRYTITLRFT